MHGVWKARTGRLTILCAFVGMLGCEDITTARLPDASPQSRDDAGGNSATDGGDTDPGLDSAIPDVDSAMPDVDSAMPDVDSGMPLVDSGMPPVDSAVPDVDSGPMGPCPDKSNAPCLVTIYDLKRANLPVDAGEVFRVRGVVTAVAALGFFMQVPEDGRPATEGAKDSGVFVFLGSSPSVTKPKRGDFVEVTGKSGIFKQQRQLDSVSALSVLPEVKALPAPIVVTPAQVATAGQMEAPGLEGALVRLENVAVDQVGSNSNFTLVGGLTVGNYMFSVPTVFVGEAFLSITGVLRNDNGASRLESRDTDDVKRKLGIKSFSAAAVEVTEGETNVASTPAATISINLPAPAGGIEIALKSSNATLVSVPVSVTIAEGALSADVVFTAPTGTGGGDAVVTATYDGRDATVAVKVNPIVIVLALDELTPNSLNLTVGASGNITAKLNKAAPMGGATLTVSVMGGATVPPSALIPEGATETTFSVVADSAGTATVSVAFAGVTLQATVTITAVAVAGPCLRISEYLEGTSNNKALELWNCGSSTLDLSSYILCLRANDLTTCSSLLLTGTLAANATLVVCNAGFVNAACNVTNTPITSFGGDDRLGVYKDDNMNGMIDPLTDTVVDAFGVLGTKPATQIWQDKVFRRNSCTAYDGTTFDESSYTIADKADFTNLGVPPAFMCP